MEHDAADRSRYPLVIDQDNSTPINFAESINFPPFQKIRTHSCLSRSKSIIAERPRKRFKDSKPRGNVGTRDYQGTPIARKTARSTSPIRASDSGPPSVVASRQSLGTVVICSHKSTRLPSAVVFKKLAVGWVLDETERTSDRVLGSRRPIFFPHLRDQFRTFLL
jgi:hypothetical protein